MIAVLQRVTRASVSVEGETVGAIGRGLMVLLGVDREDAEADCDALAAKVVNLRIFDDEQGRMNKSVLDIEGELLVVSQFTLLADCRKGRRPSFHLAADPDRAQELYKLFIDHCRSAGINVEQGVFQTMMTVSLDNDGPVTLIVDSLNRRGNRPKRQHLEG